jgi:hypothetical protein
MPSDGGEKSWVLILFRNVAIVDYKIAITSRGTLGFAREEKPIQTNTICSVMLII